MGSQAFLSGCKSTSSDVVAFTPDDIVFLNEVAETILPKTNTPGAKEANVGEFMTVIVKDCYKPEEAKVFMEGMAALQFKDAKAKKAASRAGKSSDYAYMTSVFQKMIGESKTTAVLKQNLLRELHNDIGDMS